MEDIRKMLEDYCDNFTPFVIHTRGGKGVSRAGAASFLADTQLSLTASLWCPHTRGYTPSGLMPST